MIKTAFVKIRFENRSAKACHLSFRLVLLVLMLFAHVSDSKAQGVGFWSQQVRIPDYPDFAQEPPYLIADQNNTIHAFNAQPLHLDEDISAKAIFYRQWTREAGWTVPNDIVYDSAGGNVDILGVASDSSGTVYLIFQQDFFGIYFTYAHLAEARNSTAWATPILIASKSTPVTIGFEVLAAIAADNAGNIVVIYSGAEYGKGLYSVESADRGTNWSEPYPVYLTGDETIVVTDPALSVGQSGIFHAVWTTFMSDGSAGPGYYGRFDPNQKSWGDPMELDVQGIRTPSVIAYDSLIMVSYYHSNVNGNWWRISRDGGDSWSLPTRLSPQHVGTNGRVSFVVDGQNNLHGYFGERINDQNHGVWQTLWTGDFWTQAEPVVKGPQTRDEIGGDGFDPRAARAVVSNGNVVLVTWTTDGFAGENGVWFSYQQLNVPEIPAVELPGSQVFQSASLTPTAIAATQQTTENGTTGIAELGLPVDPPEDVYDPQRSIFIGVLPVLLLLVGTILVRYFQSRK